MGRRLELDGIAASSSDGRSSGAVALLLVVVVVAAPPANDDPPRWITSLLPNRSMPLAAFIILPLLPPIAVVFGYGDGRFASNSGAGSDRNDSRWRCATPDLSSASCMPFRLMAVVAPTTTLPPPTSANRNL
jgi:hypothetical protein